MGDKLHHGAGLGVNDNDDYGPGQIIILSGWNRQTRSIYYWQPICIKEPRVKLACHR